MSTPADRYLALLNAVADNPDRADEYVWGADGTYDRDRDGYKEVDCSGLRHAALVAAGYPDDRTTADGYMRRGHGIAAPSQIGDYALLLRGDGTAHHIIMYAGAGRTVEAKGAAYGIVRDTVAHVTGKGGVWARDDRVNRFLGSATPAPLVLVPDVRGQSAKSARLRLMGLGFNVTVMDSVHPELEEFTISSQRPSGNTKWPKGSPVVIVQVRHK